VDHAAVHAAAGTGSAAALNTLRSRALPCPRVIEIPIRFRDLDMLGHVNQSVFHELLEELRGTHFGELLGDHRFPFVIARVELDYLHEVRHDHGFVRGESRIVELGRSKLVSEETLSLPDGTVAARGRTTMVAWDPRERRSRALTDEEREALQPSS
jgi:acyl-CoA thioester hydrolase